VRPALLALLALGGSVPAAAQAPAPAPVLVVQVRDSADGRALGYARARLVVARRSAAADEAGRVELAAPEAPDTLVVAALGYAAWRRPVVAGQGGTLEARLVAEATLLPDMVVTTMGRREARGAELTVATTTVDRREIEAQAAPAVDQVVAELPGVQQVGGVPAGNQLYIRGLGASRVLLLVDGEPVGGPLLENRDLSRTSTLAVERIEVTKGPGSVAHGSDAIGGVINVVTAAPEGPLTLTGEARAGSNGRREGNLSLSSGGRVATRLAAGWRQSDRVGGRSEGGSAFERVWDGRGTVRTTVGSTALRADASYERTRQRWPTAGGFNAFVDTWGATALGEATVGALGGTLRARTSGSYFEYRYREARGSSPIAGDLRPRQTERALRGLVAWTRPAGAHLIDAGAEVMVRSVDAPQRIDAGSADDRGIDLFAQDGWQLGALFLNGGGRVSWNSRWGTVATPSVGAAVNLAPTLRLRGAVARGYRAPSFKELGWNFSNPQGGYVVVGNADLRPEHSWSYSSGLSWAPGSGWRLSAEGYRNDIRQMIDFRTTGTDSSGLLVFTPDNIRRARTQGLEFEVQKTLAGWALGAGYDYLHARNLETGNALDRRAAHNARLRATWFPSFVTDGTVDLTARYTGRARIAPTTLAGQEQFQGYQEAFLSVDVQVAGRLLPGLRAQLGVDNLFDQRPDNWTAQVERRFYLGMRAEVVP